MFLKRCFQKSLATQMILCLLALGVAPGGWAGEQVDALKNEISDLKSRLAALERLVQSQAGAAQGVGSLGTGSVSLEVEEYTSIDASRKGGAGSGDAISSRWYENIDVSGFGSFGYLETGDDGTRSEGGFQVKEASIFFEAGVWDNTVVFLELQTNRLGDDKSKYVRTGEAYVHMRDIIPEWETSKMGVKVGRVDIPFGEEYLFQDGLDNPLISTSASYVYGWDEGVLVYGDYRGIGWVAAITNGYDTRSEEDDSSKAFNFKVWGNPIEPLYLSASVMSNGDSAKSALEFGGSHFQAVGDGGPSTNGSSGSSTVDSWLFEVDAKYSFGEALSQGHLWLSYGKAWADDDDSEFDRDFQWFTIEPVWSLTDSVYLAMRYSEIGTYDDDEGYHFDGKTTAGGNTLGYDVRRFQRTSLGLGWWINPRLNLKVEWGQDSFDLIDGSLVDNNNSERDVFGFELTAGF